MKWLKSFWEGLTTPQVSPRPEPREELKNFSPRAQQTLALARQEAERFNHNFVGTEHLLLGLIQLGQGVAVNVLGKMKIDLEVVRQEVEKYVGTGPDQKVVGSIPYTPRVKKVLALAAKEAKALNHTYIGTEHILLGLLREGDGAAGRVLTNLGVDLEVTRHEILKELDPNYFPAQKDVAMKEETTLSPNDKIDLSKRYDVYCAEGNEQVVYRNVLFKGVKKLLPQSGYDPFSDFMQLELADGEAIFVARRSVLKFCKHGSTPGSETVP